MGYLKHTPEATMIGRCTESDILLITPLLLDRNLASLFDPSARNGATYKKRTATHLGNADDVLCLRKIM